MKKSTKRIVCGALSLALCSTVALESVLRLYAEKPTGTTTATAASAITDVTGQYDTSKLRESYFSDSVLKAEDVAPVYETRTVMVTLSGKTIIERSGNSAVSDYLDTFSGERAKSEIQMEQSAFLQALTKKGIAYELEHTYSKVINAVAIKMDTKYVSAVKEMKGVKSAVITTAFAAPQTADTQAVHNDVVTNETEVYQTGIYNPGENAQYGEGMVVAVLDTGLDYTHPAFQGFESDNVNIKWTRDGKIKGALEAGDLIALERSGSLEVADVYMSDKVPFAYDYADDDPDVYPSYSNHGTHVAGIIGGYHKDSETDAGYTDKDGNPVHEDFKGVVPDVQLMICKVFTDDLDDKDLGGAVSEDIVAALEDCVTMGVDVINMSLGSSCGFTTTNDGDDEGEMLNGVYEKIGQKGISLICAASNDYSAGYGGVYGTNLAENPDAGTVGSPSTYTSALSVASINGQPASYFVANEDTEDKAYVFFEEARDINSNALDFVKGLTEKYNGKSEFEYVVVPGIGNSSDFSSVASLFRDKDNPRIALVKRGDTTFKEKVEAAMNYGAAGIIVYNNVAGTIRMNLGEVDDPIPAVSISLNAGEAMKAGVPTGKRVGKLEISKDFGAGPFMSEFSSWGPTPDLKLKPEITAHGGEITSAVPGGYGEQSGTSMATPNMAGFMAIVRSYIQQNPAMQSLIKNEKNEVDPVLVNRLAMQLTMSTAGIVFDQDGLPYSPRKQGAGVAKLENVVGTSAFLWTDVAANDFRPKLELGDDKEKEGVYTLTFNVSNFSQTALSFGLEYQVMTETLAKNYLTVDEQAHLLTDSDAEWFVDDEKISEKQITVAAGDTKEITLVLTLGEDGRAYIDNNFKNGMYVEGFVNLTSANSNQCGLNVPFMGFYGDWYQAPMLDYSAYEVADNEQDASVLEKDKIKASVWATQPYNMYYNDKYVLPMGGYLYLLPDDAEPMYVDEEYNAVSRYNEYYGEGAIENYMTSTGIKAVYTGLLRNARYVKYRLIDDATGELLKSDYMNRVAKAYAGGGSAVPANVKLEMTPEGEGLLANGRYKMEFEFFGENYKYDEDIHTEFANFEEYLASLHASEENTFEFSFTVDYEAPVLEEVRVRYYNYKDGKQEKQKIYLDMDVYDNHYAQTLMLCYQKGDVLQLLTDYPTPVRNAVKNGVTTVSVEVTDIYDEISKNYGDKFFIQLDDYALNTCLYQVKLAKANQNVLPQGNGFDLAEGESDIQLDIYGTHKVSLVYGEDFKGNCDPSNFTWVSYNPQIADVRNGEIVGLKAGKAKISVSNGGGTNKLINVTVSDQKAELASVPSISLGVIKTDSESLAKAEGYVDVAAGKTIEMKVLTDPWYFPRFEDVGLKIVWSSSDESVATVDETTGVVNTLKKGSAIIKATIYRKNTANEWVETLYVTRVTLLVQNEFTVSNYTLTKYNGVGYTVDDEEDKKKLDERDWLTADDQTLRIPTDLNVMYIGSEAFKDNDNIKRIIIPSSVTEIQDLAFLDCTALEEVYFVSVHEQDIADADVSMIGKNAFQGCINLKKVSFVNVKTVTLASDCFIGCTKLEEVEGMTKIGTMHHRAFAGTALTEVDLSGLHMSGRNVFSGCTNLTSIVTSKFTAIGEGMFSAVTVQGQELYPACTALESVTLTTPKIGNGAFAGCTKLSEVILDSEGEAIEFAIGDDAFKGCGSVKGDFKLYFGSKAAQTAQPIRAIGSGAFANTNLALFNFAYASGLEILGENAFANTGITHLTLSDDIDLATIRLTGIPFGGLTVTVASDSAKYYQDANGVIYNAAQDKILYVPKTVTGTFSVPASVKTIGDYSFANSAISKVVLHDEVTAVGVGAFASSSLVEVDFNGAAITEIPASAFENSMLSSITLPESVTSIGSSAFAGSAIATFVGNGVLSVGNGAFKNCQVLHSVTLADGNGEATMGNLVFEGCIKLETVTLPSLKELGYATFRGAEKLNSVTFGAKAKTTGDETFAYTPIQTVTFLGSEIGSIGYGAFFNCKSLTAIDLKGATRVEPLAFSGCTALVTVTGIDRVTDFGMQSFYDSALTSLNLTAAKNIGYMAFAATETEKSKEEGKTAAYTTLTLPAVEKIEGFAFFNGGISEIALPASLRAVGAGAFASSDKLVTVTVAAENKNFFVDGGVLYRYLNEGKTKYELTFYPTALAQEKVDGNRSYAIKEGTARILAYSFFTVNANVVDKVVLPYSVNIVGDSAFLDSGVSTYVFESIKAPILETSYNEMVRQAINQGEVFAEYKGYYYSNFQMYFYHFTPEVGNVSPLTMYYPRNGSGYTNPIYTRYFGTRIASDEDMQKDDTRLCVEYLENLKSLSELESWLTMEVTAENKAIVEAYAEELKVVRRYYNSVIADDAQAAYVSDELVENLLAVEAKMREIKTRFGIDFVIQEFVVAEDSTHKSEYTSGETFDMTGLKILIVYDDSSSVEADSSKFVLLTTGALKSYNNYVEIAYGDEVIYVDVSVSDPPAPDTPAPDDSTSTPDDSTGDSDSATSPSGGNNEGSGCSSSAESGIVIGVLVLLVVVMLVVRSRKKAKAKRIAAAKAKAEAEEKAAKLRAFENEFGEIHKLVDVVIYPTEDEEEAKQAEQIAEILSNDFLKVSAPEGGVVVHTVRKTKK